MSKRGIKTGLIVVGLTFNMKFGNIKAYGAKGRSAIPPDFSHPDLKIDK